jgi:phosphoribosylanthranilate isomerase
MAVIAEIKRRSPSKGALAPDLVPGVLAKMYSAAGAACLSVLTDEEFFGGSATDLAEARAAVDLPVLRKDFTVCAADVCDARIMGADAVLLIVGALSPAELEELLALARELELDALVEAHDEREAEVALAAGADLLTVGVFRDDAPRRVVEIVYSAGLQAAQLHGRETPDETQWVRQRVPMVIKAFPAGDPRIARAADYGADAILLDAPNPGSGKVFDWELVSDVPAGQRLVIAGGLDSSNVAAAVTRVKPWGVDVNSGVEASPGLKDPMKVKAFVEAAKRAEATLAEATATLSQGAFEGPYDWAEDEHY